MVPSFVAAALLVVGQKDMVVPGPNLVTEGIPPIPASLAASAGRYTDFRSASLQSWHPRQRSMLISTRFSDTNQVHQVLFPGGARTQLTFLPDSIAGATYQPQTGDYFVFSKDRGGDEFFQLYRYDLDNGAITLLTDGKSRNLGHVWSNADDHLAYGSTRRTGKDVDLYIVNPTDPKSDRLVVQLEGGGWGPLDWSPDDREILLAEYISINESYLWLCDVATGHKRLVTPKGGKDKIAYRDGKFSKDGKRIYVTTDKDSEFQRLAALDPATGQVTFLSGQIPWDVQEFALSHDGTTIAFLTNEAGLSMFHLFDTASDKEKPAPRLPVGEIGGLEWHRNNADLGFVLSSVHAPGDAYSVNVKTGQIERWTFSETGGVDLRGLREPELIHWKSFDGREISGFLYLPPARFSGKRPVVILIHGGPESQARPGFLGRYNYILNQLGVALILPNIRGSAGYGKEFLQLDNGFLREGAYKDIGALLDWIGTRSDLDAERIMVTGGSYGGHMTLAIATRYSDRIRCAVDVVGMSNLVTFLEHTSGYRRDLRRVEYGDERDPEMRAFLTRIAPLTNVSKIRKPLFVIQGANDPRVPRSEAEQMVAAVKHNSVPVWYLLAKDEGHGFHKKRNADFQFDATVQFMKEYLLP
jgi:dipeptidyl aminopeptidase/acylaminoacyl peptidase